VRRYTNIKPSKGTTWPVEVREAAYARDQGCLGPRVGMPGECAGEVELDHIRASGAIGMKSRSTLDNAASLCGTHHRIKTNAGRTWRPLLIDLVERLMSGDCAHVDPVSGCPSCRRHLMAVWP
jgi:hypothetical protein